MVACVCAKLLQSCPTLCDPMDCSPTGSSVHGILQARVLEWGAIALLQGIFPGIEPLCFRSPELAGRFFTTGATWEAMHLSEPITASCGFGSHPNRFWSKEIFFFNVALLFYIIKVFIKIFGDVNSFYSLLKCHPFNWKGVSFSSSCNLLEF